jgi:hypothetical protein
MFWYKTRTNPTTKVTAEKSKKVAVEELKEVSKLKDATL